jgi:hypothetical protein
MVDRRHRQNNNDRPAQRTAKFGSLPLKGNYESRASDDVLRGVGQGRVGTVRVAALLEKENQPPLPF